MNQTTKAQAPKTLLSEYEKFHFLTHEDAKNAAMLLGEKYPGIIFKASHSGSLFAKTGGSLILYVLSSSYSFIFICVLAIVRA